jgi:hypothetical protein
MRMADEGRRLLTMRIVLATTLLMLRRPPELVEGGRLEACEAAR